jgi:hypothetical protein
MDISCHLDEMCIKIWVQLSWFKVQGLCDSFVESQIMQVTSRL